MAVKFIKIRKRVIKKAVVENFAKIVEDNCKKHVSITHSKIIKEEDVNHNFKSIPSKYILPLFERTAKPDPEAVKISAEKEEHISYALICESFATANKKQRHELIEMLKERVQQFCYHRDGSSVAEYSILYGNEKQREFIVKSFKDIVVKAVKDVSAQRVILSIFDCVDDVELINNFITKEIGENIGEIICDNYGQYVLQHIIHRLNYPHGTTGELLKKVL
uniref:PUM-HD domain-containing protein n=1 Tax=Panagrolaimus davidi TaxID=227884 RepID=A0A914P527_9BILA